MCRVPSCKISVNNYLTHLTFCSIFFFSELVSSLAMRKSESYPLSSKVPINPSDSYRTCSLPVSKVFSSSCYLLVLQPHWLVQEVGNLKRKGYDEGERKKSGSAASSQLHRAGLVTSGLLTGVDKRAVNHCKMFGLDVRSGRITIFKQKPVDGKCRLTKIPVSGQFRSSPSSRESRFGVCRLPCHATPMPRHGKFNERSRPDSFCSFASQRIRNTPRPGTLKRSWLCSSGPVTLSRRNAWQARRKCRNVWAVRENGISERKISLFRCRMDGSKVK